MKKLLLSIALIFNFTTQILAQNPGPNITWQKCFSTSGNDTFYSLIEIPTGGYYATIELEKKDNFLVNDTTGGYFLIKFNADFNIANINVYWFSDNSKPPLFNSPSDA